MPTINVIHRASLTPMSVLKPDEFDPAEYLINPDQDVVVNVPREHWKIDGDQLVEMTQFEKDAVNSVMIEQEKAFRYADIDRRSADLVYQGFTFDGHNFSLSDHAQANWLRMKTWHLSGTLVFPISVSTVDNGSYAIADEVAFDQFYLSMNVAVGSAIESGRVQKDIVRALTTREEVAAYVDPR